MASPAVLVPWTPPALVMDCGTGFSKLGFAGNAQVGETGAKSSQAARARRGFCTLDCKVLSARPYPLESRMSHVWLLQPCFSLPTAIALHDKVLKAGQKQTGLEDLQYYIGDEAVDRTATHNVSFPVRQGVVSSITGTQSFAVVLNAVLVNQTASKLLLAVQSHLQLPQSVDYLK